MEFAKRIPSFADIFEHLLVPAIFERYARDLVDRARPIGPSDRILDLGCGTGIVARVLRERLGGAARITGFDVNADMLAKARSIAPDIEWVEGTALSMPFPDRSFEIVFAQQVLQFVPDRAAAVREIRRVLVPGGRLIVGSWRARSYQPLYEELGQIVERHLGPGNDKRWSLDGDELRTLLDAAGFTNVQHTTASLEERYAEFPVQSSTAAAGHKDVDPSVMATIEAESKPVIARHTAPDGAVTNQSITNIVIATA